MRSALSSGCSEFDCHVPYEHFIDSAS